MEACAGQRSKPQQRILKSDIKTIRVWGALGNMCRVMCVSVQGAPGSSKVAFACPQYANI